MVQLHPGSLAMNGLQVFSAAHLLGTEEGRVRIPDRPLQQNDMGCWSNGTTPGLQPGNRGSTPRRSTEEKRAHRPKGRHQAGSLTSVSWKYGGFDSQ